jgi:quinolinate synthase
MALNTLAAVRDCLRDGTPEIVWQPCFESAGEVVARSLLD